MTKYTRVKNAPVSEGRRRFMKGTAAIGGGLTIASYIPEAITQDKAEPAEINAWVKVRPDDTVIILYARSEMGQGSKTSAAQLVAEELECDWKKVRVEYVLANDNVRRKRIWGDMAAVGSRTIRNSQEYLRKAGATAREMLIAAAAEKWGVPASECVAANNVVTHAASKRRASYGSLANNAAKMTPPREVALKDPKNWKIAGKPIKRVDIADTVMGRQRYGIDAQVPGMLYATVASSPVFGGKVKSFDASKLQNRRGIVKTIQGEGQQGGFVAVIADNWWRAKEALKDVAIEWDTGQNGAVTSAGILNFMKDGLAQQQNIAVARRDGDVEKGFAAAAKILEAEYFTPYLAHATMEPMGATVLIKDGRVDVWTSTQNFEGTLATTAAALGVPPESVYVHPMQLGGGLGRRGGSQDWVRQAAIIAKSMEGTAVKLLWTREEDTQHDFYRPASLATMKAGQSFPNQV